MKITTLKAETILDSLAPLRKAINQTKKARHLNPLITETFDLANEQWQKAEKMEKKPFTMIIKDCFA